MAARLAPTLLALGVGAGLIPVSAHAQSRLVTTDRATGIEVYANQRPCAEIVNVRLDAPQGAVFRTQNRGALNNIVSGTALVLSLECSQNNVPVRKFTFSGKARGELFYAAAATNRPGTSGWTAISVVDLFRYD